jgi:predicted Zn-dependent protease
MRSITLALMMALGACTPMVVDQPREALAIQSTIAPAQLSQRQAIENFNIAVTRIEPVAEQMCRQRNPRQNCDFQIVIDDRPNQPVNAYQTLDRNGRPIIAFTVPLIADARNSDEIAFVMAHEAAHHIEGHIARQQTNAVVGAALIGGLAGVFGATDQSTIDAATRLGASVGARTYSKDFELEADALGTRIAAAAGFDPLNGAQFFFRIPDPGDRFLGTHPANADRLRTVQRVASGL